ncbi:transglycosylase domain-containing protein [Ideonella sp. B7]|uniref:transglycosylase domain-containing protein n=1 Tax=Ideonella benzenivorans TaxID=2831643 RepID=UPI001CED6C63|nr:transglycosylase domain-containing protein [Ideonella benzenivorans]MCA6218878.1 transglycosylase domain-containing protein [Ideonella benzenivorans]
MKLGLRLGRVAALLLLCALALQLYFLLRIALMLIVDPQSTTFQRSEAWRLLTEQHQIVWAQEWVPDERIAPSLKRAVIASEDAGFTEHSGIEWDAIEGAWQRNQKAQARADRQNERLARQSHRQDKPGKAAKTAPAKPAREAVAKVVGGSTISQQLAKNLFLSGERHVLRKAQEAVITYMLEGVLGKKRILTIYLNSVEWGEGVFGAEAAAHHYFHVDAARLSPAAAARLAVMLPAPKRFEKNPGSAYVSGRSAIIQGRMGAVDLP